MKILIVSFVVGCLTCSSILSDQTSPSASNLFQAIRQGDCQLVQNLLKNGADLQIRNEVEILR